MIKDVYSQKLWDMTEVMDNQEGYNNLEDFKKTLTSIHHGVIWDAEQIVWTHEFKLK